MAVYVLCCNARIKSHSNLLAFIRLYSVNCPSIICLPIMLYLLWRDTSSELWIPVLFPYIDKSTILKLCLLSAILLFYFTANITFHSIYLILCFQQTGEIDSLTVNWGKVFWFCCAQVPRC